MICADGMVAGSGAVCACVSEANTEAVHGDRKGPNGGDAGSCRKR